MRELKDDDLKEAIANSPIYYDESDIVREALRQFYFGHTGREPLFRGEQLFNVNNKLADLPNKVEVLQLERVSDYDDDDLERNLDNFINK
ncbi:hypothetical protein [Paenibacillus illinoisensis]|uniref:hypothetical protein n=1 Tax=Paenibacillus illinoisensis TaxID=59845 RepID=UPI0015E8D4A3|nr:hypothetical protein [Paenibacillus illinoisensis]